MELHDDDMPVGRVLSRREILALLGGGAVAAVALGTGFSRLALAQDSSATATPLATATEVPTCIVKPELTEGPYFVDEMLNRSDIREKADGSLVEGTLLKLVFKVSDVSANACAPLAGAQVDIWHCDADGVYSGVNDRFADAAAREESWLRGYQITDETGTAEFITIYPGWYPGRAVHIHFKIRVDPESDTGYDFTSQVFFTEEMNDLAHSVEPYASKGTRNVMNEDEMIFRSSEGQLTLDTVAFEDEELGEGYSATFGIGLDLS